MFVIEMVIHTDGAGVYIENGHVYNTGTLSLGL